MISIYHESIKRLQRNSPNSNLKIFNFNETLYPYRITIDKAMLLNTISPRNIHFTIGYNKPSPSPL